MAEEATWGPQSLRLAGEASRTLAGEVARRLRRDVIVNHFQPGERLIMGKLMQLYDVGSSPVREALFQVASEGLIHLEAHRGFHVASINKAEMLDISVLRAKLEADAMRRSIEDGDEAWMARVQSASAALKDARRRLQASPAIADREAADNWENRHRQLHYALCSNCGSPWLLYFIDMLYDHLERYRRYFWDYRKRAGGADDEHDAIVRAALAPHADLAVGLLKSHFQTQAELSLMMGSATSESVEETAHVD